MIMDKVNVNVKLSKRYTLLLYKIADKLKPDTYAEIVYAALEHLAEKEGIDVKEFFKQFNSVEYKGGE